MDRRLFQRCPGHVPLRITCRSGDCVQAIAMNVSEGGLYAEGAVPQDVLPGMRVLVQVQGMLTHNNPWVEMQVSRVGASGIGLSFPDSVKS